LRPIGSPMTREAEAAFSIEKPWQSHGVGSMLLERTLLAARNRGLKFLHLACLTDNKRMQQLARKYDAELSFDFSSVEGEVAAPADARNSRRRPRLRHGHVRRAVAAAQTGGVRMTADTSIRPPTDKPPRPHRAPRRPTRVTRTARSAIP